MVIKAVLDYEDLGFLFKKTNVLDLESDRLNDLLRELANNAYPTYEDNFEKVWADFYLPVRRNRKIITIPFRIEEYLGNGNISAVFPSHLSILCLRRESDEEGWGDRPPTDDIKTIIDEAMSLVPILKEKGEAALNVPFDIRTGKVKGKHVLEETLSEEEKKSLVRIYGERTRNNISKISLINYLETAAVCYRAAFPEKVEGLSPKEMYNKFSHSNVAIFPIINPASEQEFCKWLKEGGSGHAFWFAFRIAHLYPPNDSRPFYQLSSSELCKSNDIEQAQSYLGMVKALIDAKIPFEAELDTVLEYLGGEMEFSVNVGEKPIYNYHNDTPENKKVVFPHIRWTPPKLVRFK